MNGDVEELVREGLDRLTADVRVPADMAARVRVRRRRQKVAGRAALACATAAVTAVAVIAVTGTSVRPGSGDVSSARTTAYVVARVERALSAQHFVIQGRASGTVSYLVQGHRVRSSDGPTSSWSYGKRNRMVEFTGRSCGHALPDGVCSHHGGSEPFLADGTALVGGKLTGAHVTYYNDKYSLYPLGNTHVKACSTTAQLGLGGPAVTVPNWPAFIKAMLRCTSAAVTGHARIGGEQATVISGLIDIPLHKGYAGAVRERRVRVRYTLYVDSTTYLPVRAYGSTETYGGAAGPTVSAYTTNVRWLPPTRANIAKTLVTIPSGDEHVSSPADQ